MKNIRPVFESYENNKEDLPPGHQKIKCHMIFDIKLGENFRRKARLVVGGHTKTASSSIKFLSVVSRESVRIALTIAELNSLDILACDIHNASNSTLQRKDLDIYGTRLCRRRGNVDNGKMAIPLLMKIGRAS